MIVLDPIPGQEQRNADVLLEAVDVPARHAVKMLGFVADNDRTPGGMLGLGVEVAFDECDQYQLMVEDFARAVAEGRQTDLAQSRHLTRILGAMVAA